MSKRQDRFEDEVDSFMQQRGRQKPFDREPGGRRHDRLIEQTIKHMDARDLSAMLDEDDDFDDLADFDLRFQNRSRH